MNRQDYLTYRNNVEIIYQFYREHHNPSRHGSSPLGQHEFFIYMNMCCDVNYVYEKVREHYDIKFKVAILTDKNNQFIKFI
jgi:hypothetical protein